MEDYAVMRKPGLSAQVVKIVAMALGNKCISKNNVDQSIANNVN